MGDGELTIHKGEITILTQNGGLDNVLKPLTREIKLFDSYVTGEFEEGTFTGKTVLLIDDSISTGKSITGIAEEFILPQKPKRIRALTLLSPLIR